MQDYHIDAPQGSQEATITMHFHAAREIVFKAMIDPHKIPDFWGPERFITTVDKMTPNSGGSWRFVQRDQEGKEYGFHGVYHEVTFPKRLVYTSEFEGLPGNVTLYTDELTEQDGETLLISHATFQSEKVRDQLLGWGMEDGVRELTRRLNEVLKLETLQKIIKPPMDLFEEDSECITITRTINAPVDKVWDHWTETEQYKCWSGSKDFTTPHVEFDLRPGGRFLICIRASDGKEIWGTGIFEEIDRLNRLVYTDSFADEHGNRVAPSYYGMKGDQPIEMAVQVRLENLGDRTRMTLEHCGFPDREMSDQSKSGWNESFDKLEECLR